MQEQGSFYKKTLGYNPYAYMLYNSFDPLETELCCKCIHSGGGGGVELSVPMKDLCSVNNYMVGRILEGTTSSQRRKM